MDRILKERLEEHCRSARLFAEPGVAVLAVSGGPDSVAMLDLMHAIAPSFELSLVVAHADHGIHPDSARIAADVAALAARYGVPFAEASLNLGAASGETRARAARYRFLRGVQKEHGARYLVTAHHADDQAETVLLRVLHGSAPAGLASIRPRGARGLTRPLLPFRKDELAAHAASLGVRVSDDPANSDSRHERSWIRAALLPRLVERLGPLVVDALRQVAVHAGRERHAWSQVLDELPGLDVVAADGRCEVARGVLTGYHNRLAERVLRAAAARAEMVLGPRSAGRAVRFAARAASGRRIELGGGLIAEVAFDRLIIARAADVATPVTLAGEAGEAAFGGWRIVWRTEPAPAVMPRESWVTWIAPGSLACRGPAAGDRLIPLGGAGHRRVARLLMEARVARFERAGYPVVAGSEAVWVPGVCRGEARVPAPGSPSVRVEVGRS